MLEAFVRSCFSQAMAVLLPKTAVVIGGDTYYGVRNNVERSKTKDPFGLVDSYSLSLVFQRSDMPTDPEEGTHAVSEGRDLIISKVESGTVAVTLYFRDDDSED